MSFRDALEHLTSSQGRGVSFKHTTGAKATFHVKQECCSQFYELYCRMQEEQPDDYDIAELPPVNGGHIPVVVTGCFRFPHDSPLSSDPDNYMYYFEHIIVRVVSAYQVAFAQCGHMSGVGWEYLAVWLGRRVISNNGLRFVYRLQFPFCRMDINFQRKMLRTTVIESLANNGIFADIPMPISDWDENIQGGPLTQLELYGSSVNDEIQALEYFKCFNASNQGAVVLNNPEILIVPGYHTLIKQALNLPTPPQSSFTLWLPIVLSLSYGQQQTLLRGDSLAVVVDESAGKNKSAADLADDDYLGVAALLMPMVHKSRYGNKFFMRKIGKALHFASGGSEAGLRLWIDHTERAGYDFSTLGDAWHGMDHGWTSHKTIAGYARADSPELYSQWRREWYSEPMEEATNGEHARVARALYRVYWLDYTNADASLGGWYQFREHRWHRMLKAYDLQIAITEKFSQMIDDLRIDVMQRKRNITEGSRNKKTQQDTCEAIVTKLGKLQLKLGDDMYKSRLLNQASYYFYKHNGDFLNRYDNAANTICTGNGVLEMDINVDKNAPYNPGDYIFFRPGMQEDYITKATGVPYDHRLTIDSPRVHQVRVWMRQLMIEPELIRVLELFSGSLLYGGNLDKVCLIWAGPPDGGKSSWTRAITNVLRLGETGYALKGDNGVLANKRSGDGPTPSLARTRGVRIIFYEELEAERGVISAGFVKRETGNDSYFARSLHQNGGEIDPLYKIVMVCNLPPMFSAFDDGIKRRVFILPFESKWKEGCTLSEAEQYQQRTFPANRFFTRDMSDLSRALLWLMVQWFPMYIREGLKQPDRVAAANKSYWQSSDYYLSFINQRLTQYLTPERTLDLKFSVALDDVLNEFNDYFRSNLKSLKPPNGNIIKDNLEERMGKTHANRFFGYGLSMSASNQQQYRHT